MNIKLLSNRVLIDVGAIETKTPSGVIVSKAFEPSDVNSGVVVAVGDGKRREDGSIWKPIVSLGDRIVFQYGQKISVEGKTYILATEEDVIMITGSTNK